jgi:hypothetical protein
MLAIAAMMVRTVGITLLPPLVFMIVSSPGSKSLLKRLSVHAKLVMVAGGAFVGGAAALVLAKTAYWQLFISVARKTNVSALLLQIFSYRLVELGELFGNFPIWKLPPKLHVLVPWMGLLLLLLMLLGLATKRRKIGPTELFLVCYLGILFVWPFQDARFWLPVIPLLIAYTALGVEGLRFPIPKAAIVMYCIGYTALGFAAIAYSSRITFARSKFPDRYGDGNLRATYCAAFQSCRDGGDPNEVDAKVLRLLQEYK